MIGATVAGLGFYCGHQRIGASNINGDGGSLLTAGSISLVIETLVAIGLIIASVKANSLSSKGKFCCKIVAGLELAGLSVVVGFVCYILAKEEYLRYQIKLEQKNQLELDVINLP